MGSVIENEKTKEKCQIFTPDDIVKDMLDHLGYSDNLYGKTILECSCGNGQFLKEIVRRYIKDSKRSRCKKKTEHTLLETLSSIMTIKTSEKRPKKRQLTSPKLC